MGKKISWEDAQKLGSDPNKNESINDDLNGILMRLSVNCDSELRYLKEKQKAAEDCEKYEDMMFEEDEK